MMPLPVAVRAIDGCAPGELPLAHLLAAEEPVVLRGIARDWTLVQAGREGAATAMHQLRTHYNGRPVLYSYGEPDVRGRPFYREDFGALNFEVRRGTLDSVLDQIEAHLGTPDPPTFYIASMPLANCLPGLATGNGLDFAAHGIDAPPAIWIGNRVTASCHYDAPNNVACCVVGRRRFTLFPPAQIDNLYPGPLEPTPGGQVVSVVDFDAPDLARHPRFREAWSHALRAELDPGDAIYIPSMWWHHVQGLDDFTVLMNFWWSSLPAWVPTPMHALYHALWAIRDRPRAEKEAWRAVFEYYVFGDAARAGAHLPEAARDLLGPLDEPRARRLRARLIDKLNR